MASTSLVATTVLLLLCWSTHQASAQGPLTVGISINYDPPPGFTRTSNTEYKAATRVEVTCTASGGPGSGTYTYQWSSTCRECPFQTSTLNQVNRGAVHSGDTGTHTCTASRGGESASESIEFNVVGYGIHIFTGFSTGNTAAGSLPDNGLAIASTGFQGNRLRVFCRSDSMTEPVGEFIGPNGTIVTTNEFVVIERAQPGEISLVNSVADQTALTSNEQGVYTCRIPDSANIVRNINIGIYLPGFNGPPIINNPLVFSPGSSSSTLTCISTISIATTVTFTRDSDPPLTLRDGEEGMDTNGVTYQLSQTVTDRAQSTYQNVLTIDQPLGDIMGSSFTCSVANTIGSSSTSASLGIMAGACAFSPCLNGVCTPEGLTSFTCECAAGYTGTMCDIDINDCDPNPCQNEGTCTDGVASFTCDCVTGYTGSTCDVEVLPTITNPLVLTPGSSSSTLTCTSTGSPATTVTFVRDGTTLGPLRDGESMIVDRVTYQLAQTVSNRRASTYENVLTITEERSSLAGSTFTCTVSNDLGAGNSQSFLIPAVLTVHITVTRTDPSGFTPGSDIEYRAASGPHTFTCTAEGGAGSGAYQYVWTSNSSTFSTSPPNGMIIRQAVHSGDNGTHTCTASRGGESGSANTVVTIVDGELFQVQVGLVEHCVKWSSEKAKTVESSIQNAIIEVVELHCKCKFPPSNIVSGQFSCRTTTTRVTYRSTIFGIVGYNASQLLDILQEWVDSGPTIKVDWLLLDVYAGCQVHISSLSVPECSTIETQPFGDPTLITSNPTVIQCVHVCLVRTEGRGICGV